MDAEARRFYALRDRRTVEYHAATDAAVGLWVGRDACRDGIGQQSILTLINMLARVHRKLVVALPDAALRVNDPIFPARTLREAVVALATATDPYITIEFADPVGDYAALGVGIEGVPADLPAYVGVLGATALRAVQPRPFDHRGLTLGANMAACLAAASLFRQAHELPMCFGGYSAWDLGATEVATGPDQLPPLDVGDVLVVGAGAVGSALAYFLRELDHLGRWLIVDRDVVAVHNLNRGLAMFASDAGWPVGPPRSKAHVAGAVAGLEPRPYWYQELLDAGDSFVPDLILPLANGPGVRQAINQRGLPVLLHATTSPLWEAQLHRHIPTVDECIDCRLPDRQQPQFACSTARVSGPAEPTPENDAALPFLSGAAGLLLLAGLYRLQLGELKNDPHNEWHLSFGGRFAFGSRKHKRCKPACRAVPAAPVRRAVNGATRWAALDHEAGAAAR